MPPSESYLSFEDKFWAFLGTPTVYKGIFVLFFSMYAMVLCKLYNRENKIYIKS